MSEKVATDSLDSGYVGRTLRSAAYFGLIVALVLAAYGQFWAILPLISGLALAAFLLQAWDTFVRRAFSPQSLRTSGKNIGGRRWAIGLFSLIKYPLVGLTLWWVVDIWGRDIRRMMAFVGGFLILHLVMGLRALSRAITDRNSKE